MSEFVFGTFVKPEKINPYAEVVAQLATAAETDPDASVTFSVPADKVSNERFKFSKAANEIDKTARLVNKDESKVKVAGQDEDGNDVLKGDVKLTFTLTKRHKARRGAREVATPAE